MGAARGDQQQQQPQQQELPAAASSMLPGCLVRRLEGLDFPFPSVSLSSPAFEECVLWLEETHIRCLSRQQRKTQLAQRDANWWTRFLAYCREAGVESVEEEEDSAVSRLSLLRRLVGLAVKFKYQDAITDGLIKGTKETDERSKQQQQHKQQQQQNKQQQQHKQQQQQRQQQDQQDLAELLQQLRQPLCDALEALRLPALEEDATAEETLAALKAIEARVCPVSPPAGGEETGGLGAEQTAELLLRLPLLLGPAVEGSSSNKEAAAWRRKFAAALRVLHVARLQETQDEVDEALERMQLLTADPRTDHRLARVGF
ncbi:hypothetical protein Efla_007898 [Eimeria flavescens]